MKHSYLFIAGVICYALSFEARAQPIPPTVKIFPEKSLLFSKLPEHFSILSSNIEALFSGPDSGAVKIPLAGNDFFEGFIIEKVQNNPYATSINIKSTNYEGALLTISKITYKDLSVKFSGRIVSVRFGDVMLLTQENNMMIFTRKKQNQVMTE